MLCAKCGANNPDASAFCGGCGSTLAPISQVNPAAPAFPGQTPPTASPFAANAPMSQDGPTVRAEQPAFPPQVPVQPAPPVNEFFNYGTPAPQGVPGQVAQPSAPGFQSGAGYPGATPSQPGFQSGAAYPGAMPSQPGFQSGAAYPGAMPSQPGFQSGAAYPGATPSQPGFQSGAAYPGATPSQPGFQSGAAYPGATPSQPGFQSGAAYPGQMPATPGFQSGAYPPNTPMPGEPYPGAFASGAAYPGQQPQPGWGTYPPGVVPPQPAPEANKLIQPLPLWAVITSSIIVAAVLAALVFFTGPHQAAGNPLTVSDWAAGAQTAGIIALVLGVLILIAFGARSAMGMLATTNTRRVSQIVSALLLALLLFGFGAFGVAGTNSVHGLQAHTLEGQQKWQDAIYEYMAGGQSAPGSVDIARTYNGWGEQLVSQQKFDLALTKFTSVMTDYTGATAQVTQAQTNAIMAYKQWASQAAQQQKYSDAVQHYDDLLKQNYCDSACQSSVKALDATAYYNLAEQQLSAQNYTAAAAAFQNLTTTFSGSPEATRAHGDYAKALLGEGKQMLTTTCANALPIYQQLSTSFGDTPEGQQATQALNAPVQVKGHFTGTIPAASHQPFVLLATSSIENINSANAFLSLYQSSPHGTLNSDGTFTMSNVKPGSYQFAWGTLNNTDNFIRIEHRINNTTIGQLCTYDFGDLTDPVPAS